MPTTSQTKATSPVRYIALGIAIVAAGVVVTALAIYGTRQLPALAKKDDVLPGENGIFDLWDNGLFIAYNPRKDVLPSTDLLYQIFAQLLFD